MNFLNGCFVRSGRVSFGNASVYRDAIKTAHLVNTDDKKHNIFQYNNGTDRVQMILSSGMILCSENVRIPSVPTMWTQVRFNKDYPRLHRDIEFPNFDAYRKEDYRDVRKTHWGQGDGKPGFTYVIGFFGFLCGAYGVKTQLIHYITFMGAPADVLALASIEIDISKIAPGACASIKWRGKPLFIKNRTQADIDLEANTPMSALRDPQTPEDRTVKPEWLIVVGICTHLGCVPIPNSGDYAGGFYCPCHGSHYDNVGRTRKGPAPLNLEIPPYKFMSDSLVVVG